MGMFSSASSRIYAAPGRTVNLIHRKLLGCGYEALPINPNVAAVEGVRLIFDSFGRFRRLRCSSCAGSRGIAALAP